MKIIAIKLKGEAGAKILFFSEENASERSSTVEIQVEDNMETIMTDQVNTYNSPMNETKPSFDMERSVLAVDQDWVAKQKLEGYGSLADVERKVEKFIDEVYRLGFLR